MVTTVHIYLPHSTSCSLSLSHTHTLTHQNLGLDSGREGELRADNEAFISLIATRMAPAEVCVCVSVFLFHDP